VAIAPLAPATKTRIVLLLSVTSVSSQRSHLHDPSRQRNVTPVDERQWLADRFEEHRTGRLARGAGISQPYLFRLYGTKMDLFLAVVERVFRRTLEVFQLAAGRAVAGEGDLFSALGSAYGDLVTSDRRLLLATCSPSLLASTQRCGRPSGGASTRCTATFKRSPELVPRKCTDSLRTDWCFWSVPPSTCLLLIGRGRGVSSRPVTQPECPDTSARVKGILKRRVRESFPPALASFRIGGLPSRSRAPPRSFLCGRA
jgi:AcrR family transcriptional regulator